MIAQKTQVPSGKGIKAQSPPPRDGGQGALEGAAGSSFAGRPELHAGPLSAGLRGEDGGSLTLAGVREGRPWLALRQGLPNWSEWISQSSRSGA